MKSTGLKIGAIIILVTAICITNQYSLAQDLNQMQLFDEESESSGEPEEEAKTAGTLESSQQLPKTTAGKALDQGNPITSLFDNLSSSLFKKPPPRPKPPQIKKDTKKTEANTVPNAPPAPSTLEAGENLNVKGYDYDVEYAEDINNAPQGEGLLATSNSIELHENGAPKKMPRLKPESLDLDISTETAISDETPNAPGTLSTGDIKIDQVKQTATNDKKTTLIPELNITSKEKKRDEAIPDSIKEAVEDEQKNEEEMPSIGTLEAANLESDVPNVSSEGEGLNQQKEDNIPPQIFGTDASSFDISGIKLGMSFRKVIETTRDKNFEVVREKTEIPNFAKWQYEINCKNDGYYVYEGIQECVKETALKRNIAFVEHLSFERKSTREKLNIYFTSNFTGNVVKKITYFVKPDPTLGQGAKAQYIKNQWVNNFWKRINKKYGTPDDRERITWCAGENQPKLTASTGKLVLTDPRLSQQDYAKMYQADKGLDTNFTF